MRISRGAGRRWRCNHVGGAADPIASGTERATDDRRITGCITAGGSGCLAGHGVGYRVRITCRLAPAPACTLLASPISAKHQRKRRSAATLARSKS